MLRKVKLYGELADFVGHKELDAVINSTADAIRFLVSNFPKLEAHMSQRYYKVLVDDYEVGEEDIQNPIGKSDISIIPVITGAGGAGKLLAGAALIGFSLMMPGGGLFGGSAFGVFGGPVAKAGLYAGIGTAASALGGALVLSGVSDMLFPLPKMPDFSNEEDPRISFSFSGVQNTSRAGTSHPIAYGEIVTGSVVISAGIDTNQVQA
jgi:predicted phage tail protein